jgi:hypothetical protein
MTPQVQLAPGAESNAMAGMIAELVRQNLEQKPHKTSDLGAIAGTVSIVAEDAEVALTLDFEGGRLTIHDGIAGLPDVTIRGDSEAVLAMSNLPLHPLLQAPFASPRDTNGWPVLLDTVSMLLRGKLRIQGGLLHPWLMLRLVRVMSVNG